MSSRVSRLALLGLVFAASCSNSDGGGAKSTDPSVVTTAGSPSTTEAPTTTTEPAAIAVPAGVNWTVSDLAPPVDALTAVPSFDQVTATAGVPAAPPGFPFRQSDYIAQVFDVGGVQLATGSCGCWQGGDSTGVFGGLRTPVYLFRSADGGTTWAQVDLSSSLGDVNGGIDSIVERDGALVMAATVSDAGGLTPSVVQVLRSADGVSWERMGTVDDGTGNSPVHAFSLLTLGSSLVLDGGYMACEFDGSSAIQNIAPTYQRQLWTSTDGGASWIPQPPADTGFDADRPPLPDAAACAGLDLQTVTATYGSSARLVDLTADRISVWSADGLRIVTSTDGLTWTTAVLDGAIAVASERVPAPEVNSKASAIFAVDGQYVAMNLEEYRNFDDTATASSVGLSVVTWTSADGETWQRQPLGRPILVTDHAASYQFFVVDGQLALRAFDPVDAVEFGVYQSIVGEAEDWFTCVAASGANCAFSTEVSAFEPGADLSGIDLSFASLEGRDLTDVSFEGARLWATGLVGVTINRTNFDGADVSTTQLVGDLSTSSFVGATLTNISFDPQFFQIELTGATINSPGIVVGEEGLPEGLSMVGRDLTNFEFSQGDLSGVDFSGANLTDASFSFVDLSGAVFAGAVLDSVFFYEVTCPDGQPLTEGALEAALCRL